MTAITEHVHRFGPLTLDERVGTLMRGETPLFLRPKAHALLLHLARNIGRVVPKSELMDEVWPNIYVTEDSLTQSVREIRRTLGKLDEELIRTVSGRGYMLVGKIEPEQATGQQPVIAVLRFRNDADDPQLGSLVDSFAEDIVSGLSLTGSLTVLAASSTFQFASYAENERSRTALRIGADYLVEGSLRWAGGRARIAVCLIDAKSGEQIWGDRYDIEDVGIFDTQQEIGDQIVARLVSRLDEAVARKSVSSLTSSFAAYELVARGLGSLRAALRAADAAGVADARELFERAISIDPGYALAHAHLAQAKVIGAGYGRASQTELGDALQSVSRAIALAPNLSVGWRAQSLIRLYLRQHDGAEADLRLALRLNRCDAEAVEQMGYLCTMRGRPLEALDWIDRAVRLNPIPTLWYHFDRSLAFYALCDYQSAAKELEMSPRLSPWIEVRLAACYARMGDAVKARVHLQATRRLDPGFTSTEYAVGHIAFEHPADRDHLAEGIDQALRYAGDV
jgi:TolB-like protein/tetratricopeptide (TPR) repeat protein